MGEKTPAPVHHGMGRGLKVKDVNIYSSTGRKLACLIASSSPEAGTADKVRYITVYSSHAPVCFGCVFNMLFIARSEALSLLSEPTSRLIRCR